MYYIKTHNANLKRSLNRPQEATKAIRKKNNATDTTSKPSKERILHAGAQAMAFCRETLLHTWRERVLNWNLLDALSFNLVVCGRYPPSSTPCQSLQCPSVIQGIKEMFEMHISSMEESNSTGALP